MSPAVISLSDKFAELAEPWVPTIVGALNGQFVKVVRFEGEYVWHSHANEDEMFLVVEGQIRIFFRDGEIELGPGELSIVPRGIEHKLVADRPAQVVLFEPASTRNTGDVDHEYTIEAADLPRNLEG